MADKLSPFDIIQRLRNKEKVLCNVCQKEYYDISGKPEVVSNAIYFHCSNPNCTGSVHITKAIDID